MKYVFDADLSQQIAKILALLGEDVCHVRDRFSASTPDTEWLHWAAQEGRVVVTGDLKMRSRRVEVEVFRALSITAVFLEPSIRRMKRWDQALWMLSHWREMAAVVASASPGSCFRATKGGRTVRYETKPRT